MNALVILKISDSRLRRELYAKLKNRGASPLNGVFECEFNADELAAFRDYLRNVARDETDLALVYSLCAACQKKRYLIGSPAEEIETGLDWLII